MHFLISWLITTLIIYGCSELGILIKVASFSTAMQMSFFFALFYILLRFIAIVFKMTSCLTLGIGYLLGVVIQLLAYPLAILNAAERSYGVSRVNFGQAILLSLLIVGLRDYVILKEDRRRPRRGWNRVI
ncbi:MAG: phage holin family protein [Eubacteriales bacterium]|nr:phage holin family protein [Eubacteriales bacterium]